MAVAIVNSRALTGVTAPRVSVEVHLAGGLPDALSDIGGMVAEALLKPRLKLRRVGSGGR